ncbi:uncharacterized protein LOC128436559 [Pleuronectes platessa]|uniref:uncharacterized protein LOC128436559 n=1 Tax=Pleuronectes platessa TaxID=8262 RepID=UPI00232A517B|nr:uncharacterized protein LOC128436559 [Pleuronectes platessa]
MASTAVLLLQLLLVSLASASHLLGTSATYTYRGQNPDGTYKVDLHSRSIFKTCDYLSWSCSGSNCLNVVKSPSGVIDKNTNTPVTTCETETVFTTNVSSDKPFQMRASGCCWRSTANNVGSWYLLTEVDLGKRSDTGKPNRSPDIGLLPFLRVPQNCPRTYKLTSFDPDGDKVQCRYGKVSGTECDKCNLPPGFLLDQEGDFLPKLLPPTPANGAHFLAEVNKELEIRVKAQAKHATINNIIVSGPANISKHQTTPGEFVLRWTPLPDDHGQHFVICFAVEAVKPPAVYQSEMRCVLVEARSEKEGRKTPA